jgi:DNA polymerase-3 subunit beta
MTTTTTDNLRLSMRAGDLARVLALATMAIDEKAVRNIVSLTNIRIRAAGDGQLTITSNILDLGISVQATADVAQPGELAVPGERFRELVKALARDDIVTLSAAETFLTTTRGRGRWRVPLYALDDLPAPLEIQEAAGTATFDTGTMVQLLGPAFASANETTRYYLNGLYLHSVNGTLTSAATNGQWLMRCEIAGAGGKLFSDGDQGIIIPNKTIDLINKIIRTKPETVKLRYSKNLLAFEAGEISLVSKLVAGEFPDYRRVLPPPSRNTAQFEKAAIVAALERLTVVAAEEKRLPRCVLAWGDDDDAVHLTADHPEDGEDHIAASTHGHARAPFASNRLAAMLTELPGGEQVRIELNGPGSVMKITPADDETTIALLMPMTG